MLRPWLVCVALSACSLVACDEAKGSPAPSQQAPAATHAGLAPAHLLSVERRTPRIRVEQIEVGTEREAFVLRGTRGPDRIAFLHGLCSSGRGYLESFQFTAAGRGAAVAPNGDVACRNGERRSWSHDLDAIDDLIASSLARATGGADPQRITLIGYSLGATRAEQLARRRPQRYDALVLIGAPNVPSARGLRHLRGAAMLAGERDNQSFMRRGVRAFRAAGIPAEFFSLPAAAHGQMGPDAERVMRDVFDWLDTL